MQLVVETGWDLKNGLELVRALQPKLKDFGYHLCLGGGVLNKGKSKKDIDLYFLPLDNSKLPKSEPDKLVAWLVTLWGESEKLGSKMFPAGFFDPHEPGTRFYNSASGQLTATMPIEETYRLGDQWWYNNEVAHPGQSFLPLPGFNSSDNRVIGVMLNEAYETPEGSVYKHKLKFKYGEERIDVFIL